MIKVMNIYDDTVLLMTDSLRLISQKISDMCLNTEKSTKESHAVHQDSLLMAYSASSEADSGQCANLVMHLLSAV